MILVIAVSHVEVELRLETGFVSMDRDVLGVILKLMSVQQIHVHV